METASEGNLTASIVRVQSSRFVTIELASAITGYTPDAIRTKVKRGIWMDGREYVHSPDGRVLIDMEGYERWASPPRSRS